MATNNLTPRTGEDAGNWRGGPLRKFCSTCGCPFSTPRWKDAQYCSRSCYQGTLAGKANPNHRHGQAIGERKSCPRCGAEFNGMAQRVFCSVACQRAARAGTGNPMFKDGRAATTDRVCPECAAPFRAPAHRKFCSRRCKAVHCARYRWTGPEAQRWRDHYSATRSGENNQNWRDGRAKVTYGPGWTDALRKRIRARDGNACRCCGSAQRLQIHHRDESKFNHADSNLLTLCQTCHVRLHHHKLSLLF
jgi:endogenous inhibitor of DNA gyrase (YacG/DUF329 family)